MFGKRDKMEIGSDLALQCPLDDVDEFPIKYAFHLELWRLGLWTLDTFMR